MNWRRVRWVLHFHYAWAIGFIGVMLWMRGLRTVVRDQRVLLYLTAALLAMGSVVLAVRCGRQFFETWSPSKDTIR
ncbi:MAG: hypothetical protein KGL39_56905 [Patescibacteria group bacterium]|nr:hypothetical protein [Patescibacteria group bacterium]